MFISNILKCVKYCDLNLFYEYLNNNNLIINKGFINTYMCIYYHMMTKKLNT